MNISLSSYFVWLTGNQVMVVWQSSASSKFWRWNKMLVISWHRCSRLCNFLLHMYWRMSIYMSNSFINIKNLTLGEEGGGIRFFPQGLQDLVSKKNFLSQSLVKQIQVISSLLSKRYNGCVNGGILGWTPARIGIPEESRQNYPDKSPLCCWRGIDDICRVISILYTIWEGNTG